MSPLNDLAKQLEERRQQLGGKDGLKEQFQKMKNLGAGPAEKAAQAMKQGDWKKALEEVEKLAKDLKDGKMDAAAKEQLAKQLEQMKEKLEAAAQAHQQAMDDLKKQIEQQKKQGNLAKAGELQQKLDQLQKQTTADGQAAKAGPANGSDSTRPATRRRPKGGRRHGPNGQTARPNAARHERDGNARRGHGPVEMAKDAMGCKFCNGEGCENCMGNLANMGMNKLKNKDGKPGRGMGQGKGIGERPEERTATNLRDTQVRGNPRKGAATFGGLVDGPNIKGDVAQSIKEEMATLSAEPADPLTSERLPNSRREHAEQYFQMLRDGK